MGPFGLPTLSELVTTMESQEWGVGLFLAGAGVVFLVVGFRIANVLVPISFGVLGFMLGWVVPVTGAMPWVCASVGAVGLGAASVFVHKPSVAILAGGWSGYLAMLLIWRCGIPPLAATVAGALVLGAAASLAFIMYEEIVAFVTSLEGSVLFICGLVVFASHNPGLWPYARSLLVENPFFGPFLILAGTVTGFYCQVADLHKKQAGSSG